MWFIKGPLDKQTLYIMYRVTGLLTIGKVSFIAQLAVNLNQIVNVSYSGHFGEDAGG